MRLFFLACCHLFHHEYFFFLSTIATTSLSFETLPFRTRIHCCCTFFVFIEYNVSNFVSNWKENCINLYYEEVIECDHKCLNHKTTAARKYWPQTKSMHSKSMLNDTHFHTFWSKIPWKFAKLLFIILFYMLWIFITVRDTSFVFLDFIKRITTRFQCKMHLHFFTIKSITNCLFSAFLTESNQIMNENVVFPKNSEK